MNTSTLPRDLMSGALLHFEQGVPIDDLKLRAENRRRLARVEHVYWQWVRNPFTIDYKALLRQLVKGKYADAPTECHAAQKDVQLFEFIKESIAGPSRRDAEVKVRAAAEKAIRIGMETDNVTALTKGGKLLYEVAGLDKPESEQADMSRMMFIPPVITTSAHEVDDTKEDYSDQQALAIMNKYGAHIDEKRKAVEERVDVMLAARGSAEGTERTEYTVDNEKENSEEI